MLLISVPEHHQHDREFDHFKRYHNQSQERQPLEIPPDKIEFLNHSTASFGECESVKPCENLMSHNEYHKKNNPDCGFHDEVAGESQLFQTVKSDGDRFRLINRFLHA